MGGINPQLQVTHAMGARRFNVRSLFSNPISFYKFRGWYAAESQFEVWVAKTENRTPPSGHVLLDVVLIDSFTLETS